MAGGLFALLDDVALIAKKAAASAGDVAHAAASTSTKAAAVVVDDTAVAPDFVRGVTPARELPIVWQITKGSLVNKIVIILPVALLLSWLAPWALTPILMVGGTYLSFEGAEKLWHAVAARRGSGRGWRHRPRRVRGGEGPGR
jgi:predicted DNA repair protein MutK